MITQVILAIVDDLLFASKIRAAAGRLDVSVTFARSAEIALAELRARTPSLVILDLNSPRTDPMGIVAAMKADPATSHVPTVGFVSHVQTDVIDTARQAGIDQVLARSAFVAQLQDILTRAS
jgi:CheY-like chemotaxis protein